MEDSENENMEEVIKLLKLDPALTTRIIAFSNNSGFFCSTTKCQNIAEAIERIGPEQIFELVGAATTSNLLTQHLPVYKMHAGELWTLSVICGNAMEKVNDYADIGQHTAYTIGLLHGLGKVIINKYHEEYEIKGYREIEEGLSPDIEKEIFGFTHEEVAAVALAAWNFPPEVYVPINYQLRPLEARTMNKTAALLSLVIDASKTVLDNNFEFMPDPECIAKCSIGPEVVLSAAEAACNESSEWLSTLNNN